MSELTRRFPKGHAMLRSALARERIPLRMVKIDMIYTGVSWGIRVDCDAAGYHRQDVLGPYALCADTAFGELCQWIAEELAESLRGLPPGAMAWNPWPRRIHPRRPAPPRFLVNMEEPASAHHDGLGG